jgi:hypothetical protein
MIYQEHGHRGIWSMSIAAVERSPDIKIPSTKIHTRESMKEPHCTEGTFEYERRSAVKPSTRWAAIV